VTKSMFVPGVSAVTAGVQKATGEWKQGGGVYQEEMAG
jgi:hypothetical protein